MRRRRGERERERERERATHVRGASAVVYRLAKTYTESCEQKLRRRRRSDLQPSQRPYWRRRGTAGSLHALADRRHGALAPHHLNVPEAQLLGPPDDMPLRPERLDPVLEDSPGH